MGLWSRIRLLFNIKASSALDRAEALPQVLNYAYNQQQEQLRKLRQGLGGGGYLETPVGAAVATVGPADTAG